MRILVIGVGPWNDVQYGNNVMTNWFTGYPATFANIYTHTGEPCNQLCESYYQITDEMMVRSILGRKAGRKFQMTYCEQKELQKERGLYVKNTEMVNRAKRLPVWISNIAKDAAWIFGRFDKKAVKAFIEDFNPDIIFCHRVFGFNFWRIEKYVRSITSVPMVAFTGDSEVSLRKFNFSPFFWIRQISLNLLFRKHIKRFSHYFTFSEDQACRYNKFSGVPASTLYKCADLLSEFVEKPIGDSIRMVYAGNIIYNRWKTIADIADAIDVINRERARITLDVFTNTPLTKEMESRLANRSGLSIHGRVKPDELTKIYKDADIALHIESFSIKDRLETKDSFSTKIVDLMNSTCAIMAICWKEHNGLKYLQREDAALCITEKTDIIKTIEEVCNNPQIIQLYARKAWECGNKNHRREVIQAQISKVFEDVINTQKK